MTAIQDSSQGAFRLGRSLEGKGYGQNGSRVRRKLDLLGTRASSDTSVQCDLEIGARAAIGLVLRRCQVPVPGSRGGTGVAATCACRDLELHMPVRCDAHDDPTPESQNENLGQQCQQEGKAAEVGNRGHLRRRYEVRAGESTTSRRPRGWELERDPVGSVGSAERAADLR